MGDTVRCCHIEDNQSASLPCWNRYLREIAHNICLPETHKCRESLLEEVNLTDEYVTRFRTRWNFPHKVVVQAVARGLATHFVGASIPGHARAAYTLDHAAAFKVPEIVSCAVYSGGDCGGVLGGI